MYLFYSQRLEQTVPTSVCLLEFGEELISDFSTEAPFLLLSLSRSNKKIASLLDEIPKLCFERFDAHKLEAEVLKSGRLMVIIRVHDVIQSMIKLSQIKKKVEHLCKSTKTIICFAEI